MFVGLTADDSGNSSFIQQLSGAFNAYVAIYRAADTESFVAQYILNDASGSVTVPSCSVYGIDARLPAGKHTYRVRVNVIAGGRVTLANVRLVAFEL